MSNNFILAKFARLLGLDSLGNPILFGRQLQPFTATVAANALTVTLNPSIFEFRPSPVTSGVGVSRTVASAISLVVPTGATLGTFNGVASRLVVLAIDNAGTVELAIANADISGGVSLNESGLITTVILNASSTSSSVIYSTAARSNVAYRIVGTIDSSQATAGTWASSPTVVNPGTGLFFANTGTPIGVVQQYAGSTAPSGYLMCDGLAYSRTVYAALFNVIGTTYGGGDGSTTFNVPNSVNRVPVGAGGLYARGATGGSKDAVTIAHTHTGTSGVQSADHYHNGSTNAAGLHQHRHISANFLDAGPWGDSGLWGTFFGGTPDDAGHIYYTEPNGDHAHTITTTGMSNSHTHDITTNSTGVAGTDQNMQPYVAFNSIIKF